MIPMRILMDVETDPRTDAARRSLGRRDPYERHRRRPSRRDCPNRQRRRHLHTRTNHTAAFANRDDRIQREIRRSNLVSFHFRRHAPPAKQKLFTNTIATRPSKQVQIPRPSCTYCSMKSTSFCEIPSCKAPLCARHVIRKAGGGLCPKHKNAVLVQYDGLPCERFGDRGEAHAVD